MKASNTLQWVRLIVLVAWGVSSVILIACEENPGDDPMPIIQFVLIKVIGLCSFTCCIIVGKRLERKGMLPEMEDID